MKRVKVVEEPKIHAVQVMCGAEARDAGRGLDDIEHSLLRSADLKASWRKGWQDRDAELARKAKRR